MLHEVQHCLVLVITFLIGIYTLRFCLIASFVLRHTRVGFRFHFYDAVID